MKNYKLNMIFPHAYVRIYIYIYIYIYYIQTLGIQRKKKNINYTTLHKKIPYRLTQATFQFQRNLPRRHSRGRPCGNRLKSEQ
jgi:CRISPR/Cas system-associated exonuclease Cas4 (RecB family)